MSSISKLLLTTLFCILIDTYHCLEPYKWHLFENINKVLLYQPICTDITYNNYIDSCEYYNKSKPMSIVNINEFNSISQLISEDACNDIYIFGGTYNENNTYVWWNNIHSNTNPTNITNHVTNPLNIDTNKYLGISIKNETTNIVQTSLNNGGIICEIKYNPYYTTPIDATSVYTTSIYTTNQPTKVTMSLTQSPTTKAQKVSTKLSPTHIIIIVLACVLVIMIAIFIKTQNHDFLMLSQLYSNKRAKKLKKNKKNHEKNRINKVPSDSKSSELTKSSKTNILSTTAGEHTNIVINKTESINQFNTNDTQDNNHTRNNIDKLGVFSNTNHDGTSIIGSFKLPKTPNIIVVDIVDHDDDMDDSHDDEQRNFNLLTNNNIYDLLPPSHSTPNNNSLTSPRLPRTPNMMGNFDNFDDDSLLSANNINSDNDEIVNNIDNIQNMIK